MFTPPEITTLRFMQDGAATQSEIADTTKVLIGSRRAKPQLRVFLAGHDLSAKTIAALISALRKLREVGGAIELRAENKAVRQIILRHGLERVFEFPPAPSAPAAKRYSCDAFTAAVSRAIAQFGTRQHVARTSSHEELWMVW